MTGRVEPHTVGSIMHVIKRGTRGIKIVQDKEDRIRFMRSLYYLNDVYSNENWKRDTMFIGLFERPVSWPEREPLVNILAWTLLPNHFHLLLQERTQGGIADALKNYNKAWEWGLSYEYSSF